MTYEHHCLMAALVYIRFNRDHEGARAAWSRMLQNQGWDDTPARCAEWEDMVSRGLAMLRANGMEQR